MPKSVIIDQKRVKNRIAARNQAMAVLDLAKMSIFLSDGTPEWDDGYGADYAEAFIENLTVGLKSLLPQRRVQHVDPPAPQPFVRLAANTIPFGKYAGQRFDQVPLEYLDWLCREQEGFYKVLREYLKHPEMNRDS